MPPPGRYRLDDGLRDAPDAKPHVGSTYLRLAAYVRPYGFQVASILAISIIAALISTLPPQLIGLAVDQIKTSVTDPADMQSPMLQPSAAGNPPVVLPLAGPVQALTDRLEAASISLIPQQALPFAVLGLVFILLHILEGLVTMGHAILMARVGQGLIFDMRNQVYQHLQRLSLRYFENQRTGDIMSRVVNDVNSLEQVIVGPVVGLITDLFRLGWIIFFLSSWDFQLTLYALLVGPVLVTFTFTFGRVLRRNFRKLRTRIGDLNTIANDNISGVRIIKVFSREAHEAENFAARNHAVYRQNLKLAALFAVFRPTVTILTNTGSAIVLFYGGYKVLSGSMSIGTFVVFFPYLSMLYGPVTGLTRFWSFLQRAVASVERVFEVLDTRPEIRSRPDAPALGTVNGDVRFEDVHFAYEEGAPILKGVNLHAKPGQMIALVGPSGAGKTTLIGLVPRFYDPTRGCVTVDGQDIRGVELTSLRKNMSMVLQEPFLFNDTIRANIAYGKIDATEEDILHAARTANADAFIRQLPRGYDTVVGERGVKLSGGQKQRISIARALLANPRILILDEATSSVDTESETLIQEAIDALASNRTTFVIAHRLSTVLHADQILVMDKGQIVERGTHGELLAANGLYKKLFEMQFRTSSSAHTDGEKASANPSTDSESRFEGEDEEGLYAF